MREDKRKSDILREATGMNDPNYKYNPHPKLISPQEMARLRKL